MLSFVKFLTLNCPRKAVEMFPFTVFLKEQTHWLTQFSLNVTFMFIKRCTGILDHL